MTGFDLFTIGHSNMPAERFMAVLRGHGIDAVADVRTNPVSRFCPWFSARNLKPLLQHQGMEYAAFCEALGGRPTHPALYCGGVADYEAMAQEPEFLSGLDRLASLAEQHRLCLLCAERDPLDCHRCLLVGRALAERGLRIGHVLFNGSLETHHNTERRLLQTSGAADDLFVTGQRERLAAAYRRRAREVAYRPKPDRARTREG